MLTFLCTTKPFVGLNGENQLHTLANWKGVAEDVEILVFGDAPGTREACEGIGCTHIPEIDSTEEGVPYFNAMADYATEHAQYDHHLFANADMLFDDSLSHAFRMMPANLYMFSGQKFMLNENVIVDNVKDWKTSMTLETISAYGWLCGQAGMDYFGYPRGAFTGLRPCVCGRGGIDNALILYALRNNITLVDTTLFVPAIHQFHNYSHVEGGEAYRGGGPDAQANYRTHKLRGAMYDITDADYYLTDSGLIPGDCLGDKLRAYEKYIRFSVGSEFLGVVFRVVNVGLRELHLRNPRSRRTKEVIAAYLSQS